MLRKDLAINAGLLRPGVLAGATEPHPNRACERAREGLNKRMQEFESDVKSPKRTTFSAQVRSLQLSPSPSVCAQSRWVLSNEGSGWTERRGVEHLTFVMRLQVCGCVKVSRSRAASQGGKTTESLGFKVAVVSGSV